MVPSGMDLWYGAIRYGPMVWCHQVVPSSMDLPSGMDLWYAWCHQVWTYGIVPSGSAIKYGPAIRYGPMV